VRDGERASGDRRDGGVGKGGKREMKEEREERDDRDEGRASGAARAVQPDAESVRARMLRCGRVKMLRVYERGCFAVAVLRGRAARGAHLSSLRGACAGDEGERRAGEVERERGYLCPRRGHRYSIIGAGTSTDTIIVSLYSIITVSLEVPWICVPGARQRDN
jgi:hypothetical protein